MIAAGIQKKAASFPTLLPAYSVRCRSRETQRETPDLHLSDGDQVLLCTDGPTGMVRDETIATILNESDPAAKACHALIDLALAAGGSDNTTVVVARYRFPHSE